MNEGKPFVKGGLPRTILDGAGVTNTIADTLAHLYAKPSTIESSTEFQISGINGTASNNAKGTVLPPSFHLPDIKLLKQKSASRLGSNLFGNNSDAAEAVCKSSVVLGVSTKKKSDAVLSSLETSKRPQPKDILATTASQNASVNLSLSGKSPAFSNNGNLDNGRKKSSHHGSKLKKKEAGSKNTEKSTLSSSSAGESGEESGSDSSSTATSETSSVDSEGELNKKEKEQAEEACRQLQIAQLKEKRKELRKEVRKLKHANHEAATAKQNKSDQPMTLPKTSENLLPTNTENVVVVSDNNDKSITPKPVTPTPVPSLAHSTIIVIPPTLISPAPLALTTRKKTVTMQQETIDSSMPLDLCVKKSEPSPTRNDSQPLSLTMYDSGSAVTSTPLHFTAGLANSTQLNLSGINNSQTKKRGRKPKPLPGAITNHSDHSTPRGRPATDIYLNSSHSSRGDTFSIPSLDISNLSALGSRGTHHHQLILPSPFSTIEGLKIPDLSNRVSSAASSSSSAATGRKRRCKVIPSRIVDYKDVNANKNSFGSDSRTLNKTTDNSVASSSSAHSVAGNSRTSDKQYIMDHHNDGINHSTLQSGDHHRKREDERLGDSYSSSDSESSVDSGSESNSTGKSSTASSTQTGVKRHRTDRSESRAKKKKLLPDDKEIRIPLEYGWRRQTRMRCISRSGVKGEVCYYSPCGKKLRNYPEVIKYLQKNGINDIARENFSFNPKVIVGEYNERLPGNGPESNIMLSEQEVAARIEELRARKHLQNAQTAAAVISKLTGVTISSIPAAAHAAAHAAATQAANAVKRDLEAEEKQKKWEEIQMQRRIEQQAIARQNQKLRALRRAEQNNAAKESKRRKVEDIRRQKEHQKLVKQQEKMDKMEQQRMEKELRNQQLLEVKSEILRYGEREMKRQQAAILREQELQKRRDMLLMVDLERERRRQHMMLVRALETRKKTEERDKKNKEIIQEKEVQRLKKMEQRRLEMQLIREIKKPVDDMMLKDATPLPILNRIPGLKISAKAFGDLLMVFEFLHNFGETLGFDMENLPSLSTFQLALLNHDEKNEEELLSVVHHLLVCAIDDPGVPHPRSALTVLGQTLREVDITNNNISEVLRLYVNAVDRHCEVAQWLCEKPFLSLNPTKKAGVLAFLCHELLCSKIVVRQVDLSIDSVNNLKREKWVVEGQLRKLRGIQQRRKNQAAQLAQITENLAKDPTNQEEGNVEENDGKSTPIGKNKNAKKTLVLPKEPEDDDDLDDLVIDSGNESDETQETGQPSEAEDDEPEVSNEELEKKIEKLTKVQNQFHNKLLKTNNSLRATTMGQDRYRRRYWILPKAGGIFVESLESSEILKTEIFPLESLEMRAEEEERLKLEKEKEEEEAKRKAEEEKNKPAPVEEKEEIPVKEVKEEEEKTEDNAEKDKVVKVEQSEVKPTNKSKIIEHKEGEVENIESPVKVEEKVVEDNSVAKQKEAKEIKRESEKLNEINSKKVSKSSVKMEPPIVLPDQKDLAQIPTDDKNNWLLHSPLFASILTGSLLMNSPLMHGREINGSYIGGIHAPIKGASTSTQSHAAAAAAAAAAATSEATFNPFMGLPPDFITAEQIMKHFTDSGNPQPPQRNWFSILPKIACDDSSLTLLPGQKAKVAVIPTEMPSTTASTSTAPSTSVVPVSEPPKIKAQTQTTPTASSSKTSSHSSKKESAATAAAQEGALKNLGPLGIFPPEVTNKITASALANLQLGLLNGIPPNILMHSFMAAHGIGPLYQSGNNSQVTPSNQPPVMNSLPSASNDDANSITLEKPSGCNTPNSIQMEADLATTQLDHPKRAMVERMQYDAPKPIPLELQHGWWRITDINQLKEIFEALHSRGIREKIFHKHLEKYYNYATSVCYTNQMTVTDLEITDLDREISAKIGAAPDPDPSDYWLPAVALRVDLAILELVESLEDKIAGASMQIKRDLLNHPEQGWKVPPKLTSERAHLFNAACTFTPKPPVEKPDKRSSISAKTAAKELELAKKLEQSLAAAAAAEEAEREKDAIKNGEDDTIDADGDQEGDDIENPPSVMDSEKNDNDEDMDVDLEDDEDNYEARAPLNPVEVAQTRLLKVEAVIERRYIRPPLGTSTELNLSAATSSQSSYNSDEITPGLIKWRRAVQNCTTSAQLALCINMLENCIAWDKSIMRASCQFCHSGDNEEMLLLCDGCDKGYHTYCFKPKMETIPDGDWYCYECLNKATGDKVCIMCGKKGNKMLECEGCPKTFHMTCLEPPVTKAPKGRWACPNCSHKLPSKKSSSSKSKSKSDKDKKEPPVEKEASKKSSNNNADTSANATASTSTSSKSSSSKEKKEKIPKPQGNKDLAPCKIIIEELECHEDAWPFLLPVNVKQFPTYRKVIKKSMDLSTMKSKLETGGYKVREEFVTDARLIFDNCETFNEDDSPVGIAGHNMRAFFECRWSELCGI